MILTDLNCPSLRYVKWDRLLFQHPELQRDRALIRAGKHTDLSFLSAPRTPGMDVEERKMIEQARETIDKFWPIFAPAWREDIWTASKSFVEAFDNVSESIAEHRTALYSRYVGKRQSGLFVGHDGTGTVSVFYDFEISEVRGEPTPRGTGGTRVFWKGMIFTVLGRDLVSIAVGSDEKVWAYAVPVLRNFLVKANSALDAGLFFSVMDQLIFREWCNVVTVERTEKKAPALLTAVNESVEVKSNGLRARMYGASWFTEIVRTEGFARRGYWGIRWKGKRGGLRPELVPVRATQVKGYVRRAGKGESAPQLSQLDNQNNNN